MNINYRVGRTIIFLLVVFTIQSSNIYYGPDASRCSNGTAIKVPAKPADWRADVLTKTSINVEVGDTIYFFASGEWDVGSGNIGPNGKEDWCECLVSQRSGGGYKGYLGALVGRIGLQGKPFLIGAEKTITAKASGKLFLGSNDNMGPCIGTIRGSCYEDNSGVIEVCVKFI